MRASIPVVKICCISSLDEARMAIDCGAKAIGLVSEMPSGPGVIDEETIAVIAAETPKHIQTFLLTSRQRAGEIIEQHGRVRTTTIQIVDRLTEGTHAEIKRALPGVSIVQVVHVSGEESIDEASRLDGSVDALLLDSGNQNLEIRELGGTGRVHNWEISREIVMRSGLPVYLAGGLKPENVRAAVDRVGPFGLDLCSGVRTQGRLDESKLEAFFRALNGQD